MVRKITLFFVASVAALSVYAQHEPVDLGLSVDWASCNLGAYAPEQYGAYYAWGEATTKSVFSWNTYRYGTNDALSKYNKSDGSRTLAPEDDAASAAWGGTWRMPTKAECAELLDKCTWTWNTRNGVSGYIVTGPSGNTIFLPACGQRENSETADIGSWGCYWSATLNHRSIIVAESLSFDRELSSVEVASRIVGQAVRPVCAKNSVAVSLPGPGPHMWTWASLSNGPPATSAPKIRGNAASTTRGEKRKRRTTTDGKTTSLEIMRIFYPNIQLWIIKLSWIRKTMLLLLN